MTRIMMGLIAVASFCVFGSAAFAQQDLPFCHAKQSFGELVVNAFADSASILLPQNPAYGSRNTVILDFDKGDWWMKLEASRPAGTFKKLASPGQASIRFVTPSGTHQVEGWSELRSVAADRSDPARFPASDAIKLVVMRGKSATGLVKFLERASVRGETVELIAKADNQLVNQYKFKMPDFDKAVAWGEQQMRLVAEMKRTQKCRLLSLF